MDRVSSNIIINDFNKEKEKQMKHTEIVMEEWQRTLNQIDDDELDELLLERAKYRIEKYPVIKIDEVKIYRCVEYNDDMEKVGDKKGYFLQFKWLEQDEWIDVSDLSELKIWEYNKLVDELHKHYPDYPIEHLEGRFV